LVPLQTVGSAPETEKTGVGSMVTELVTVDEAQPPTAGIA
jgi:hypothetical protein